MKILDALRALVWPILGGMIIVAVAWIFWTHFVDAQNSATQGRVERNQATAGIESARDAVGAVAASQGKIDAIDQIRQENDDAIRSAPGADAPVDPALAGAARRGLCRYAAYRGRPECVQQPDPRAVAPAH